MTAARTTRTPKKPTAPLPPAVTPLPVRRFTVAEYHTLIEVGVISENDRVELLHGWIVEKSGINPPHNYAVNVLMKALQAIQIAGTTIRVQQPITTPDSRVHALRTRDAVRVCG